MGGNSFTCLEVELCLVVGVTCTSRLQQCVTCLNVKAHSQKQRNVRPYWIDATSTHHGGTVQK